MGSCVGLDHTELLPPFMPVGDDPARAFGILLQQCDPDAFVARLPVVPSFRSSPPIDTGMPAFGAVRLMDILAALLTSVDPEPWLQSAEDRLRWCGERLCDFADLPADEFRHRLTLHVAAGLGEALRDRVASRPDASIWPADVGADGDPEAAFAACRRILRSYARLLLVWPDVVAAAGYLKREAPRE